LRDRTIGEDETTVVILTGHGLKAAERIALLPGIAEALPAGKTPAISSPPGDP